MPSVQLTRLLIKVCFSLVLTFGIGALPALSSDKKISEVDQDIQRLQQSISKLKGQQNSEQKALEKSGKQVASLLLEIRQLKKTIDNEQQKLEAMTSEKKS